MWPLIAQFVLLVVPAFKYVFYNVNTKGDNKNIISVSVSVSKMSILIITLVYSQNGSGGIYYSNMFMVSKQTYKIIIITCFTNHHIFDYIP